jgi:AraC-like DNA-binding protein
LAALQRQPLLRGLLVVGAGHCPKAAGHHVREDRGADHAVFLYCSNGRGWCETRPGKRLQIGSGDFVFLAPGAPHAYGPDSQEPWTVYWVSATGALLQEYLANLGISTEYPILQTGEGLQMAMLFSEILKSLAQGPGFRQVLKGSAALAHLLAALIARDQSQPGHESELFQRIGQSIGYMSDHLDEPLKVADLASLANLSPAHFAVVFKEHTGSSPRDYLHLLRMHRATEWLIHTRWPLKEIADRLGYRDQFHFSRKFKSFTGLPPSRFRERR